MTEEKAVMAFETMINIIDQDGEDIVTAMDIPLLKKAIEALNYQIKGRVTKPLAEDDEESRLPQGYAEIEYADMDSFEAVQGMKFDDMNMMRYMER